MMLSNKSVIKMAMLTTNLRKWKISPTSFSSFPYALISHLFLVCGVRNIDCQTGIGSDYQGSVNKTVTGRDCQQWSSETPHSHSYSGLGDHNHCRNPGSDGTPGAWCYTMDPEKRWERCDVRKCSLCDHENGRKVMSYLLKLSGQN